MKWFLGLGFGAVCALGGQAAWASGDQSEQAASALARAESKSGKAATKASEDTAAPKEHTQGTASRFLSNAGRFMEAAGYSVTAGAGANGFSNRDVRRDVDTGVSYTARFNLGTKQPLGLELAYIGGAYDLDAIGLGGGASLLANGIEGDIRVNVLSGRFQPYVLLGGAWKNYTVVNETFNTSNVNNSDNVLEIPAAVGLTYRVWQGMIVDARAAYRLATFEDLLGGAGGGGPGLSNWDVGGRLGWEF